MYMEILMLGNNAHKIKKVKNTTYSQAFSPCICLLCLLSYNSLFLWMSICSSPGGSDGRCRILGTRRPGEKCFGPTTNCKGLNPSCAISSFHLIYFWFLRIVFHLKLSHLPLSAHDGQKLCRTATQNAVRFHRLCVLLCVQGKGTAFAAHSSDIFRKNFYQTLKMDVKA